MEEKEMDSVEEVDLLISNTAEALEEMIASHNIEHAADLMEALADLINANTNAGAMKSAIHELGATVHPRGGGIVAN